MFQNMYIHKKLCCGIILIHGHYCCCGQGHQEAKSPETTEQNAEEAHRARGAPRGALRGEIRGNQTLR